MLRGTIEYSTWCFVYRARCGVVGGGGVIDICLTRCGIGTPIWSHAQLGSIYWLQSIDIHFNKSCILT